MSTNNTEGLNFKIVSMGKDAVDQREPCNLRPLTLEKLFEWIDAKTSDARLKDYLKKSASKYPNQALSTWQKNYTKHVATAQKFFKKQAVPTMSKTVELGDEDQNEIDTHVPNHSHTPHNEEFD